MEDVNNNRDRVVGLDPYQKLAKAIMTQAENDYLIIKEGKKKVPKEVNLKELEDFFCSELFELFSSCLTQPRA